MWELALEELNVGWRAGAGEVEGSGGDVQATRWSARTAGWAVVTPMEHPGSKTVG